MQCRTPSRLLYVYFEWMDRTFTADTFMSHFLKGWWARQKMKEQIGLACTFIILYKIYGKVYWKQRWMDQVWVPQLPITLSYIFNVYRSLYKTKIDENTIFQSIRLLYFFLVVASVEEKSIHVYAQSKKH